jgi:hypothetical protein
LVERLRGAEGAADLKDGLEAALLLGEGLAEVSDLGGSLSGVA